MVEVAVGLIIINIVLNVYIIWFLAARGKVQSNPVQGTTVQSYPAQSTSSQDTAVYLPPEVEERINSINTRLDTLNSKVVKEWWLGEEQRRDIL